MHAAWDPIEIDGPEHPHAFDGLPIRSRPEYGHHPCITCRGHGCWNELLFLDSGRCRLKGCDDCDGSGWRTMDGHHVALDIVMENGHPKWIVRHLPLVGTGEPMHTAVIIPIDPAAVRIPTTADPDLKQAA